MVQRKVILNTSATGKFPDIHIFLMPVTGLLEVVSKADIATLYEEAAASLTQIPENVSDTPEINAWRHAFKAMGLKPSKYHSSIEALLRRARKDPEAWQTGIASVDLYNSFSIKHVSTLGGYDSSKIPDAPLQIRAVDPAQDYFDPLGADASKFKLSSDNISYMIGNEVACWCLNHRDSRNFSLDSKTDTALFCSEAISSEQKEASARCLNCLAQKITQYGGKAGEITTLSAGVPEGDIKWP